MKIYHNYKSFSDQKFLTEQSEIYSVLNVAIDDPYLCSKNFLKLFTFYALSTTEAQNVNNIGDYVFSNKANTIYYGSNGEDHQQERAGRSKIKAIPFCAQYQHTLCVLY